MNNVLSLAICVLLMPLVYVAVIASYRCCFEQKKNRERKLLRTWQEILVLILSTVAIFRLWVCFGKCDIYNFQYMMLVILLYGMSILCMTDYWEKVIPNRILLYWLLIWLLLIGIYGVKDINGMMRHMFGVVLGIIFCMFSFGLCYLISKGSMGAGDVKLSLIMGLYMTGDYVVGAVLYGCILSAAFSIFMLLSKKLTRKDSIPFVPFLYLGVVLRYLVG